MSTEAMFLFTFKTKDGKLRFVFEQAAVLKAYGTRLEGKPLELTIRQERSKRSELQNKYYWGVVIPTIAEHCGYTREEMHEALKAKFLGQEDLTVGLRRIGSTTKLSTQSFADYVDQIMLWAAEQLGVVVPPPEREVTKREKRKAA